MISVSYLKSIFEKDETIKKIDESICDMIHVDLMDGLYVTKRNIIIDEVIDDLIDTNKPLDIHLMVRRPLKYIDDLAKLKPYCITVHIDIDNDVYEVIDLIKDYNIKVGLAINPDQDIKLVEEYLPLIDYVLLMSVTPGVGGQPFMESVLDKIDFLTNKNVLIGIDGGINEESIKLLKNKKIDNIISGSFVCMKEDFNKQISILKQEL